MLEGDLSVPATLSRVKSPTLLIVGEVDYPVIKMNEDAYRRLRCEKELKIVPSASHLFEERGTLEEAARLAADWFRGNCARMKFLKDEERVSRSTSA